jgi:structural maintenance of chromosome 2
LDQDVNEKQAHVDALEKAYQQVREEHTRLEEKYKSDEALLQTLLTGLGGTNNSGGGYMGQLAEAKTRLAQAKTEEEQTKFKLGVAQNELKDLEKKMKDFEREAADGRKKLENTQRAVEQQKQALNQLGWNKEKEDEFVAKLNEARRIVRHLSDVSSFTCFY